MFKLIAYLLLIRVFWYCMYKRNCAYYNNTVLCITDIYSCILFVRRRNHDPTFLQFSIAIKFDQLLVQSIFTKSVGLQMAFWPKKIRSIISKNEDVFIINWTNNIMCKFVSLTSAYCEPFSWIYKTHVNLKNNPFPNSATKPYYSGVLAGLYLSG